MINNYKKTEVQILTHTDPFLLESGATLNSLDIAWCSWGALNQSKDNVIWICHALTGNADALDWWDGLVGSGKVLDTDRYFVICANVLGSCYGATCPASTNPATGKRYGKDFPLITIRDMVQSHEILRRHLGIKKIALAIGGSMGGQQVLEWAIQQPDLFEKIVPIATNAQHSPWGIAFNESQRMAMEADPTLFLDVPGAGQRGLEAARAIAMLSYRHYRTYDQTQQDETPRLDGYRASSYQKYQGVKLSNRFYPLAYYWLSKAMDSHHVGRGRNGIKSALDRITAKTYIIGIETDLLFPVSEQQFLQQHIRGAQLSIIKSDYGHDGFLVEYPQIIDRLKDFLDTPVK